MKTLILYRHCKSSWDGPGLADIERPLNIRGENNAKSQAKVLKRKLKKLELNINYFFISPSLRTKKTFKPLIKALKIKRKQFGYFEELYDCSVTDLKNFIKKIDSNFKTVMIIGHNPSFENFIKRNTIMKSVEIPTGTFVILYRINKNKSYNVRALIKP